MTALMAMALAVRVLTANIEVNAPLEKAWKAWTTAEGAMTFLAPECHIEPRLDGRYEVIFNPAARAGDRGTEGTRVLGFEPMRRLAVSWIAPPRVSEIHQQRTMVILEFHAVSATRSRVRFMQLGWGEGKSWDAAYEWFARAWNELVLPRFRYAMEVGPIDWKAPPKLPPLTKTLKGDQQ